MLWARGEIRRKRLRLCLSSGNRTALERLNLASHRPPEMVPVGPGWQGAEGLGVSYTGDAISVGGKKASGA
jgi:hypothetical protein